LQDYSSMFIFLANSLPDCIEQTGQVESGIQFLTKRH
jgi:hypothetical protein